MNAVLILPDQRDAAAFARRIRPLALMPIMGRELLDLWLEKLASEGVKKVTLLAADRPEEIRRAIGNGGRWGLRLQLIPVPREPEVHEARALFATDADTRVLKLESLPSKAGEPLWESTEGLYDVLRRLFRVASANGSLTMRRLAPDVFVSTQARIASTAVIEGPAWIGPQVIIADNAHILPGSIIEKAAYIDRDATVRGSWVGPKTYVGAMTEISHSFAWGDGLENWRLASFIEITDDFLLASLRHQRFGSARAGWSTRAFALLLMVVTAPLALMCMAWARFRGLADTLIRTQVILPAPARQGRHTRATTTHALNGVRGLFSRWPELWLVCRGEMHLMGNRPLTPVQAGQIGGEFEQLWLAAPAGVFALADAMDDGLDEPEAALTHAAWYSVHRGWRLNLRILLTCLPRFLTLRPGSGQTTFPHPHTNTKTNTICHA